MPALEAIMGTGTPDLYDPGHTLGSAHLWRTSYHPVTQLIVGQHVYMCIHFSVHRCFSKLFYVA